MNKGYRQGPSENSRWSRRAICKGALSLTAAAFAKPTIVLGQNAPFNLMKLPYDDVALHPVISANTISYHYGKHHAGYVTNLNKLLETDELRSQSLTEIIKTTAVNPNKQTLFNNAAQVWNHDFYWHSLSPKSIGKPGSKMLEMIDKSFGGYDKFRDNFAAAAIGQFGSGWAWLVLEGDKLAIRRTSNADTPVYVQGVKPLLTLDVWEHAYYLDYQNRRADYVHAVIDKLLNWEFAEKNLG